VQELKLILNKRLKLSHYGLLGVAAALTAIYMALVWKSGDNAHLGMSAVFFTVTGMLLWDKRHQLDLEQNGFAILLGILLVGFLLWQSVVLNNNPTLTDRTSELALRLFPLIIALSLTFLTAGFKGLKRYYQEISILFFLGVPSVLVSFLPDISPITAKVSAFLLWYSGFNASVKGTYIHLPSGAVEVYSGCSGIESMTYLLGVSVICLTLFPTGQLKRIFTPLIAVTVGFFVNSIRVALMAILVASDNKANFMYWHEGDGSLIFGMVAVIVFLFIYYLLVRENLPDREGSF
jgi:cyanoexosortase A